MGLVESETQVRPVWEGIFPPEPPFDPGAEHDLLMADLYWGIRSREHLINWRSLLVGIGQVLGIQHPEHDTVAQENYGKAKLLTTYLLESTDIELAVPLVLQGLGLEIEEPDRQGMERGADYLLYPIQRSPDEAFWGLVDELRSMGKRVLPINPVDDYNDGQPRVGGVASLGSFPVNTLVIMGSTQHRNGGSTEMMVNVGRTIRSILFTPYLDRILFFLPMYGGSRGHRLSQRITMLYEVLEAIINPKILGLAIKDVMRSLTFDLIRKDIKQANIFGLLNLLLGKRVPALEFYTVDIHNDELPGREFLEMSLKLHSCNSAPELAGKAYECIEKRGCGKLPIKIVVSDRGAVPRTELMTYEILKLLPQTSGYVDVVYLEKHRTRAGEVNDAKVERIERWSLDSQGNSKKTILSQKDVDANEACVIVVSDDMFDTGGTMRADRPLIENVYTNIHLYLVACSHAVLSQGVSALNKVGADGYIFTDSLVTDDTKYRPDVYRVRCAKSFIRQAGITTKAWD